MMEKRKADADNTSRRKWDREEYEEKAKQRDEDDATEELSAHELKRRKRIARDPLHQGIIVRRAELKSRDYELDLTSRLGKTQVITHNTPLNQQAGYYCNVCDCILRDSASYLDHINGKWHNRALGMSMRVEKSSVDQVRKRLEKHRKQDEDGLNYVPDGFEDRVKLREEEEAQERQERKHRRRAKKDKEQQDEEEEEADPDMMALMGFSGFGGSTRP